MSHGTKWLPRPVLLEVTKVYSGRHGEPASLELLNLCRIPNGGRGLGAVLPEPLWRDEHRAGPVVHRRSIEHYSVLLRVGVLLGRCGRAVREAGEAKGVGGVAVGRWSKCLAHAARLKEPVGGTMTTAWGSARWTKVEGETPGVANKCSTTTSGTV